MLLLYGISLLHLIPVCLLRHPGNREGLCSACSHTKPPAGIGSRRTCSYTDIPDLTPSTIRGCSPHHHWCSNVHLLPDMVSPFHCISSSPLTEKTDSAREAQLQKEREGKASTSTTATATSSPVPSVVAGSGGVMVVSSPSLESRLDALTAQLARIEVALSQRQKSYCCVLQ